MSIAENVAEIRRQMEVAALAAGRDPKGILLCAATKMNDADAVRQAIAAGVDCCGENRVQELTAKLAQNAYDGAPVHFLGHLQTNKVRQVVGKVSLIQSVDSERLLAAIDREAARQGIVQDILLEVNIGGEEAKSGFAPAELTGAAERLASVDRLDGEAIVPAQVRELSRTGEKAVLEVIIHQGKKRQIRRMCAQVGLEVARLKRVAEDGLVLGELPCGHWRYLTSGELDIIKGSDGHE